MVKFPNAKINLGLHIISKRTDGFHNLASCFYPVNWTDALEILPSQKLIFTSSGISIPGDPNENICLKVYAKIKEDHDIPPVHIHLHKNISIGAGLGGGSSDAAFSLKILNELFDLKISAEAMEEYLRPIGSDCAFFVKNTPRLAINKGDAFEEFDLNLSGKYIVLIYPHLHISTKEAYSGVLPHIPEKSLKDILKNYAGWKKELKNDFEISILSKYPELSNIKEKLYELGAEYASMSGSGSSIYGIFDKEIPAKKYFAESYKIYSARL